MIKTQEITHAQLGSSVNGKLMPDRSWTGLTKPPASSTVVQQCAAGKYATVGRRRKRGGELFFQGQAKEKDGSEDGGESRNSKCGHYDWQMAGVG